MLSDHYPHPYPLVSEKSRAVSIAFEFECMHAAENKAEGGGRGRGLGNGLAPERCAAAVLVVHLRSLEPALRHCQAGARQGQPAILPLLCCALVRGTRDDLRDRRFSL